ncbi:hypothetical protein PLANTIT3_20044 [Plantibacter sp. T3]|nr:hypothetical protein PLANTIT3_20044 [Plantibacter sp. T3]
MTYRHILAWRIMQGVPARAGRILECSFRPAKISAVTKRNDDYATTVLRNPIIGSIHKPPVQIVFHSVSTGYARQFVLEVAQGCPLALNKTEHILH